MQQMNWRTYAPYVKRVTLPLLFFPPFSHYLLVSKLQAKSKFFYILAPVFPCFEENNLKYAENLFVVGWLLADIHYPCS